MKDYEEELSKVGEKRIKFVTNQEAPVYVAKKALLFGDPKECSKELLDLIYSKMVEEEFKDRKFFDAEDKDCLKREMDEYKESISDLHFSF